MAHTPTPWYDDDYRAHAPVDSGDPRNGQVIFEYKHSDNPNVYEDKELIFKAVNTHEALVEALRKTTEEQCRYEKRGASHCDGLRGLGDSLDRCHPCNARALLAKLED